MLSLSEQRVQLAEEVGERQPHLRRLARRPRRVLDDVGQRLPGDALHRDVVVAVRVETVLIELGHQALVARAEAQLQLGAALFGLDLVDGVAGAGGDLLQRDVDAAHLPVRPADLAELALADQLADLVVVERETRTRSSPGRRRKDDVALQREDRDAWVRSAA